MKKHEISADDPIIFKDPYIISLASCARSDRSKSFECHVDLENLSRTKYIISVVIDAVTVVCETTSKEFAVARYNEVDI